MAEQIVMDRNGDTRHQFDAADPAGLAKAEERFSDLTGKGFRAVALGEGGEPGQVIRTFDSKVEKTLFVPHLKGG